MTGSDSSGTTRGKGNLPEMTKNLLEGEEDAFILVNEAGSSPYVLVCEHASNRLPKQLGNLGLSADDLQKHIAWDIGAEGVSRLLSRLLDAPLVLQRYSRLAYDCNRPPDSPGAMPEMSETTPIPGNMGLSASGQDGPRFGHLLAVSRAAGPHAGPARLRGARHQPGDHSQLHENVQGQGAGGRTRHPV